MIPKCEDIIANNEDLGHRFFIFCFTDIFCNKLGSKEEMKIKFMRTIFQLN